MTAKPSRATYYAASVATLLFGVRLRSLVGVAAMLLDRRRPCLIHLRRPKARFLVRSLMDVWTVKEVCLDRDYERAGAPIQPGWVVIDIGAGIGEFAIDAALRHPGCAIHAFEPSPESFEMLCQNLRLNHLSNVRTHAVAVTGVSGQASLDVSSPEAARHHVAAGVTGPSSREVAAKTLAEVLHELDVPTCDLLKIDCEGGEYALLLAAGHATLGRISRICLEYHDGPWGTHDRLVAHLAAAGFEIRLTGNRAWEEIGFLYAWRPDLPGSVTEVA